MKRILFLCIENSCRSQMAEEFFNKYADKSVAYSAGSAPAKIIDQKTIKVMKEKGINLTNKKPRIFNFNEKFDFIITMGCNDTCPITANKTITWNIEDPKGKNIQKYRAVRDEIEKKVEDLIEKYKF